MTELPIGSTLPTPDSGPMPEALGTLMTGVRATAEGLDLAHAAVINLPADARTSPSPLAGNQLTFQERRDAAGVRLADIINHAATMGVGEDGLKTLVNMVSDARMPNWQLSALQAVARRQGITASPQELLTLVLGYDKEQTRATAQGPVFHYHQTGMAGLPAITHQGAVLSSNEQQEKGIASGASGSSRPDVVQFTRDEYDSTGALRGPGLSMDVKMGGGSEGSVALIFDESIMDDPAYDGVVKYPNRHRAPLADLYAVAVDDPETIPSVQQTLADGGIQVPVITRQQWLERYHTA